MALYPKNAKLLLQAFDVISMGNCQGWKLWIWVERIASLKLQKIIWDPSLEEGARYIGTIDGTDFLVNKSKTERYNINQKACSHKFKHGALKYIIVLSPWRGKCVFLSTAYRGGESDKNIYKEELHSLIPPGKYLICDRGFVSQDDKEGEVLRRINTTDSKKLQKMKARALARHETFNGRLKFFKILRDYFHHRPKNHCSAFEAVCVIVQYQIDNGHPLFDTLTPFHSSPEKPKANFDTIYKTDKKRKKKQSSQSSSKKESATDQAAPKKKRRLGSKKTS